jgi:hypothetical protein
MTVMPASRGRPRPTIGRRVSTTLGTGGLITDSAPTTSPAQLTPEGAALNAERLSPSSPSPSASAPISTHDLAAARRVLAEVTEGTGRNGRFELLGVDRLRVDGGRIVENIVHFDTAAFETLIGAPLSST